MIIRQAKLYDIPAIARIEEHTSAEPWSAQTLTNDVTRNDNAYVAVVIDGDEVSGEKVGYADMWTIAGEAQLNNIGIEAEYRGRGLGEALLKHMIDKAIELGCDVMTLEVRAGNTPARSLYRKLGFVEVGLRNGYYGDNHEDAILMDKSLSVTDGEVRIDIEIN